MHRSSASDHTHVEVCVKLRSDTYCACTPTCKMYSTGAGKGKGGREEGGPRGGKLSGMEHNIVQ